MLKKKKIIHRASYFGNVRRYSWGQGHLQPRTNKRSRCWDGLFPVPPVSPHLHCLVEPSALWAKVMVTLFMPVWSMKSGAGLPLPSRVEATPPWGVCVTPGQWEWKRRTRSFSELSPLLQERNGYERAADQRDNAMLPAVRCPKRRQGRKEQRTHCGQTKKKIWQGSILTNDPKMKWD